MSDLTIERYRLVLTHDLIVDGKEIRVEEPKTYQLLNWYNGKEVTGYTNHILDELFYRFREELKEKKN